MLLTETRIQYFSVDIVARLPAGQSKIGASIYHRHKITFDFLSFLTSSGFHAAPIGEVPAPIFWGLSLPECESNHSPPSRAVVKKINFYLHSRDMPSCCA